MSLSVDFESRSRVDLRKSGVYVYAEDASTDLWCMAWSVEDEEPVIWVPGMDPPDEVARWVEAGNPLRAYNAQFERIIWRDILGPRYGFPVPELEQWYDTAAEAAAMALPRNLEDAAVVLGLDVRKDAAGRRLMLKMSKPRKPTKTDPREWWDDEDSRERLYEYCRQDVRVEQAVAKHVRRLTPTERRVYLLDQRINDRGVQVDLSLVEGAQNIVDTALAQANDRLRDITGIDGVTKVKDITEWLQAQDVPMDNLRKDTVRDMLDVDNLEEHVRDVLVLRQEGAKSSTAKLRAMVNATSADGRSRGLLLYHGASTGRWSGKLIQPQNFPRGSVKNVERFIDAVRAGDYEALTEPPLEIVSSMLRSMFFAASGRRLVAADFSQIEARIVAWIAGQDDLVDLFAAGGKVYETMAAAIYGIPVEEIGKDSTERQIGKVTILGAGYGMGWEKFRDQTKIQTGIELSDADAQRAINTYRERNTEITGFWRDIERAAIKAVKKPGSVVSVGRGGAIRFTFRGHFLYCVLPSGRPLVYAYPKIGPRPTPWGETRTALSFMGVNSKTRKWQRITAYGGLLTENVVQAMARDVMAEAMLRVEEHGYPVILTVHDEVVTEPDAGHGSLDEFMDLLHTRPAWAHDAPIAAEGWEGERYRK